ncbi:hypothetical protein Ciccas_007854, partial [Cichlidogyrus casuarinus]
MDVACDPLGEEEEEDVFTFRGDERSDAQGLLPGESRRKRSKNTDDATIKRLGLVVSRLFQERGTADSIPLKDLKDLIKKSSECRTMTEEDIDAGLKQLSDENKVMVTSDE